MPVLMNIEAPEYHLFEDCEANRAALSREKATRPVKIGLINNMPDSALISTERQIFNLLDGAARKIPVELQLYALPTVVRGDWGQQYVSRFYDQLDDLWNGSLDGVIVTGAEPQAVKLSDEPYWDALSQVIDWAAEDTASAIWSCLAVHATVLYLDRIDRHQLRDKCSGVFQQTKVQQHLLTRDVPSHLSIPHSRWNEVREDALLSNGYSVLTRSIDAGVDMFVKQHKRSLFVCFQGHPEYDAHSLLGEYRRDIGRYLRRESERYPTMPRGYFDKESTSLLQKYQMQALSDRRKELLASFPADPVAASLKNTWQSAAKRIYSNWISYLKDQRRRGNKRPPSRVTKSLAASVQGR